MENYGKYYSFVTIEGVDVGTKKLSKLFNPVRDTIRYAGDIELELSLISSDYEQMFLMKPRFYVDYMGKIIYCFESTNVVPKKQRLMRYILFMLIREKLLRMKTEKGRK